MAQHDYIISNQTFPNTRADINNALLAISSNNTGTSAPTTQYAGQFWIDTNTPSTSVWTLYIHDGSDDIPFATIDTSANTVNFSDSALDVVTDTTPQLGGNLDLNSKNITGTGNINITGTGTFSGDLAVNTNTLFVDVSADKIGIGTASPEVPLHMKSSGGIIAERFQAGAGSTLLDLRKSRNATIGSHTILQNGDGIGGLVFRGSDGTNYESAAAIFAEVDGTPGTNDMPGRLTFSTTADGANAYTERLRITSAGLVGIGTSSPTYKLTVQASADNQDLIRLNHPSASTAGAMLGFTTDGTTANNVVTLGVQYSNADFDVINIQRSTQNVGISETAPQGKLHVKTSDSGVSSSPSHSNELVLENSTNGGITFNCGASNSATMTFQNSTNADDGSITYRNSEREFRFKTAGADRMRFHSNGVISSTGGIALGVGTANTASNVLDDYEEGTWTPDIRASGNNYSSVTHSAQTGRYTKVGRLVTAHFIVAISAVTIGGAGGNINIGGLPFTCNNTQACGSAIDYVSFLNYNLSSFGTIHVGINARQNLNLASLTRTRNSGSADGLHNTSIAQNTSVQGVLIYYVD